MAHALVSHVIENFNNLILEDKEYVFKILKKNIIETKQKILNKSPYMPDVIKFDDTIYNLSEKLDCSVIFEDDNYIISNEKFDLTVWGDTREEAEQAFCFAFSALYQNFAKEQNENLSDKAREIKTELLKIVKAEYIHEAEEK